MILSVKERLQFQYLLPVQGNLKALELVESIAQKIFITDESEKDREFVFEIEEIELLKNSISILDKNNQLSFQALSVIRKIMEEQI